MQKSETSITRNELHAIYKVYLSNSLQLSDFIGSTNSMTDHMKKNLSITFFEKFTIFSSEISTYALSNNVFLGFEVWDLVYIRSIRNDKSLHTGRPLTLYRGKHQRGKHHYFI